MNADHSIRPFVSNSVPTLNEAPVHRRILVIEDSIVAGMMITARIEREQPLFDVRIRRSMSGGLEELERFQPDVVILDLTLPDSSSEESIAQIPVFTQRAKVLVATGEDGARDAALAAGAHDFMVKAIGEDSTALIERVNALAFPQEGA